MYKIFALNPHIQVNSFNPVCLAWSGFSRNNINQSGNEFESQLENCGKKASVLLCGQLCVSINIIADLVYGCCTELPCIFLR